jgi:hypothetical protein
VAAGGAKTTPAKQQKATPVKRAAPDDAVVVIGDSDDDELVVAPKRARVAAAGVWLASVCGIRLSDALTAPRPHLSGGGDALACQEAGAPACVQPKVRQEGRDAEALVSAADVRACGRLSVALAPALTPARWGPTQLDSLPPEEELKFTVGLHGGRACASAPA